MSGVQLASSKGRSAVETFNTEQEAIKPAKNVNPKPSHWFEPPQAGVQQ